MKGEGTPTAEKENGYRFLAGQWGLGIRGILQQLLLPRRGGKRKGRERVQRRCPQDVPLRHGNYLELKAMEKLLPLP